MIMMRIEKGFSLILIATFICQNTAFCIPQKNFTLRAPLLSNKEMNSFVSWKNQIEGFIDFLKKKNLEMNETQTSQLKEILIIEQRAGLREKIILIIEDIINTSGAEFGLANLNFFKMLMNNTKEKNVIRGRIIEVLYKHISLKNYSTSNALVSLVQFSSVVMDENESLKILDNCDSLLKQEKPVDNMLAYLIEIHGFIRDNGERDSVLDKNNDLLKKMIYLEPSILDNSIRAIYGSYAKRGLRTSKSVKLTQEERLVCIRILFDLASQEASLKKLSESYMSDFIDKYVNLGIPELEGLDAPLLKSLEDVKKLMYIWWMIGEGKDPLELVTQAREEFIASIEDIFRGENQEAEEVRMKLAKIVQTYSKEIKYLSDPIALESAEALTRADMKLLTARLENLRREHVRQRNVIDQAL